MLGFPHHIDITVTQLKTSIAFYDLVLGRLGYHRSGAYAGGVPCWLTKEGTAQFSIGLHASKGGQPHHRYSAGLHHLAFSAETKEQVDSFYEFLLQQNVEILDPPAVYDYSPGYYAVFFTDPDGIKLEVVFEPKS